MNIIRLTKRLGRTINTGDHEFLKIEMEVTGELTPTDSYEDADQKLFDLCRQSLNADVKRFKEAKKK